MRGKMRVSLPGQGSSKASEERSSIEKGRKVIDAVAERENRARSLTETSRSEAVKRLKEAQRCLDNSMNEWKLLQQGDGGPSGSRFVTARRTHLLKTISDMRKKVNSEMSLLFCHEVHNGGEGLQKVGKHGYPDLNNQSAMVLALQRMGVPMLFDDLSPLADGPMTEESLGNNDLLRMLGMFDPLNVDGRRYSFTMNSTRDEVTVSVVGVPATGSSGSLLDRIGPDLKGMEGFRTIVERPAGSGERYIATEMEGGGIVQLEPLEQDTPRQSMAMPAVELLTEISEGRSDLKICSPSGPLAHRRAALHVVMSVIESGGPVLIELEDEDGKAAREYLVDELDMASRKMVLIDPVRPRGVNKTDQFYGRDLDRVLERWGKRGYVVTTFRRRSLNARSK